MEGKESDKKSSKKIILKITISMTSTYLSSSTHLAWKGIWQRLVLLPSIYLLLSSLAGQLSSMQLRNQ